MAIRNNVFQELEEKRRERAEADAKSAAAAEEANRAAMLRNSPSEVQRERERRAEVERRAQEEAASRQLKSTLRRKFLSVPGMTEADFEKALPRLLESVAFNQATSTDDGGPASDNPHADPAMWGLGRR